MIPARTFNLVAQSAHFHSGWAWVLALCLFFGHPAAFLIAWAVAFAVKEGVLDYLYETPEVRGSSALDFALLMAGAAFGLLLYYAAVALHRIPA